MTKMNVDNVELVRSVLWVLLVCVRVVIHPAVYDHSLVHSTSIRGSLNCSHPDGFILIYAFHFVEHVRWPK